MIRNREFYVPKEVRDAYIFVLPLILSALVFVLFPVTGTWILSLFRDVTFLPRRLILWGNYQRLVADPHFWQSARFTFLFVLASVSLELVLGTIFALVLNENFRARGMLRVSILIPWAIPVAVSARIWQLMYNYDYGLLNFLVVKLGVSSVPINWLGSPVGAFASLVMADVWKTTPFITIILLAGLAAIPRDVVQAGHGRR